MSVVTFFIEKILILIASRSWVIFYCKRITCCCWTKNWTIRGFLFVWFERIVINLVPLILSSIYRLWHIRRLCFWDLLSRKSWNTGIKGWFLNGNFFQTFYILPYFLCSDSYILFTNLIKRFFNALLIYYKRLSFGTWFKYTAILKWLFILIEAQVLSWSWNFNFTFYDIFKSGLMT